MTTYANPPRCRRRFNAEHVAKNKDSHVNKLLLITSIVLILAGILLFLYDFLPVEIANKEDSYLKIVSSDTFSILNYRLHLLVTGLGLLVLYKLKIF